LYFYSLSNGCYSDYSETKIFHRKQFTKEEFIEMFNHCFDLVDVKEHDEIAEKLCEVYGFGIVEPSISVFCDYGSYRKLSTDDIKRNSNCIDAEDKTWRIK
jgi:hypothetical protein